MPFSWSVAIRFLKEGRLQSVLIIVGASIGVAVMIFLTALINGVQTDLIDKTLGTQAHIEVRPLEDASRSLLKGDDKTAYLSRSQQPPQRLKSIASWPKVLKVTQSTPGIVAAAPVVSGVGFASRGAANKSVTINGVNPESFNRIVSIKKRIVAGAFRLQGGDAVIGTELAKELGVAVGDKIRCSTAGKDPSPFTIRGIFDAQNKEANLRWVFMSISNAQGLLDLAGGVSSIQARVTDIFEADQVAAFLARRTDLVAESWMTTNGQLLVALRSQSSSSSMIQFFVILAVALGIASVLFVSVIQKSKEIGILKAMGTHPRKVTRIFVIQGFIVGLAGSVLGCGLGAALAILFRSALIGPDGTPILPITLELPLFVRSSIVAIVSGIVASAAPAKRAAKLDPATVIRNG